MTSKSRLSSVISSAKSKTAMKVVSWLFLYPEIQIARVCYCISKASDIYLRKLFQENKLNFILKQIKFSLHVSRIAKHKSSAPIIILKYQNPYGSVPHCAVLLPILWHKITFYFKR